MNIRRAERVTFWLFAGPALLGFVAFSLWPMLYSLWLSFCQYEVIAPPRFIGLRNYIFLFQHDAAFWPSVRVTLIFTVVQVPLAILAALAFALLLHQPVRARGFWRAIYFMPSILPQAAYAVIFGYIFQGDGGLLNRLLALGGIEGKAWTMSPDWALPVLIMMSLWGFGYPMVIFLAGLQNVPRELHEAAHIDGAGAWARFRHITLPLISPVLFFNLIMGAIAALKVFDLAYAFSITQNLPPGGPARATLFYGLNLYQQAFGFFHMGLASAMAWLLFLFVMAVTAVNFGLSRRWVHYDN
ncbi:MAG: sugar ABC transporter permease [Opitutaceae bacterium]|nr:sugar ABC transporter permease [Cephaloticoccus sp.]MCP5531372.1 sugar ABC transporter permease [Opitutaceae bacterium]